ncbi:putative ovate protein family [Helianthus annuus]|nr:putative ovate protein family [Helianthus annuus]
METNFKLKISKLFQSSFTSCRTKHTSDVVEQPFFFPENRHHRHLIDLFSPKPQPISSSSHKSTTQLPLTKLSDEKKPFSGNYSRRKTTIPPKKPEIHQEKETPSPKTIES